LLLIGLCCRGAAAPLPPPHPRSYGPESRLHSIRGSRIFSSPQYPDRLLRNLHRPVHLSPRVNHQGSDTENALQPTNPPLYVILGVGLHFSISRFSLYWCSIVTIIATELLFLFRECPFLLSFFLSFFLSVCLSFFLSFLCLSFFLFFLSVCLSFFLSFIRYVFCLATGL